MTRSLDTIFAASPKFADELDVDNGVLRWLAEIDTEGDPSWHQWALRALADAAIDHTRIATRDAVQEALLGVHIDPDKFRAWSRARRSARFLRKAWHNLITDALRRELGDHRITIEGARPRVYAPDETPWSQLTAVDEETGQLESLEDAAHRVLGSRAMVPSAEDVALANLAGEPPPMGGPELPVEHVVKIDGKWYLAPYPLGTGEFVRWLKRRLKLPLMSRALWTAMQEALESISDFDRDLLLQRHGEFVDLDPLSEQVGLSRAALEKRLTRARAAIRANFRLFLCPFSCTRRPVTTSRGRLTFLSRRLFDRRPQPGPHRTPQTRARRSLPSRPPGAAGTRRSRGSMRR